MKTKISIISVSRVIVVIYGIAFYISAFVRFSENDFMYAIAPALLDQWSLYQDLPFLQAPLSVHLYKIALLPFEPTDYYVTLRLVSLAFILGSSILVYRTTRALAGQQAGIFSLISFYSAYHLQFISSEIGNYSIALFFVISATYILFTKPLTRLNAGLVGLCIGLAGAAKLTHGLFAVPFGIVLAIRCGLVSRQILSYLIFGMLGSLFILYYAIKDFSSFYFFNVEFHLLVNEFRETNLAGQLRDMVAATKRVIIWFAVPTAIVLTALCLGRDKPDRRNLAALLFLVVVAYAIAMLPKFIFDQYIAPMAAFLCVATPYALVLLLRRGSLPWSRLQATSLVIIVALSMPYVVFVAAPRTISAYRGQIVPLYVSRLTQQIHGIAGRDLLNADCERTAVSLSGIPFLGASFELTPFSAAGPFMAQLESMQPKMPASFARFADAAGELRRAPPTAILVGYFPNNAGEAVLRDYAVANDYVKYDLGRFNYGNGMELFLRRTCLKNR